MKFLKYLIFSFAILCVSCSQDSSDIGGEIVFDMEQFCKHSGQCILPGDYAVRSDCPYMARCIEANCYVVCPDLHSCDEDDYRTMVFENGSEKYLSPHEITEEVFLRWLEYHRERKSCQLSWLEDFSVSSVDVDDVLEDRIEARISFSVLPTSGEASNWMAGNGEIDGEWIREKSLFVTIGIKENTYSLLNLGTGP